MDKILNKKYMFIILVALVMSFSIGYFTTNNGLNEERIAAAQDPNYDKMKISYVNIKERKTGAAPFNSISDDNGNDENETNEYVRTYDYVYYTIEVGIERNSETTTSTETIKGGKIKVKATIPKNDGLQYLSFIKDSWMQSYNLNNTCSEITATYIIPADKTPVGGTQQLSFTLVATGNEKQLKATDMPIFEVWMDGNKPDNQSSSVDSVIKQDSKTPLRITGSINPRLDLSSGLINVGSELNNVKGQFINFYTRITSPSNKGTENPVDVLTSSLKIEYRYKKSTDSTWTNLDSIEGLVDPINGTILYSYGRPCEPTPGFWPNENKNTTTSTGYCASGKGVINEGYLWKYDSGVMEANQTGNIINFSNTNFSSETVYPNYVYKTVAADGFELFVPWYEPETEKYDYEIKIIDTSLNVKDHNGREYQTNPNQSITFRFSNYLTGNFNINLTSGSNIFTDVAELPLGNYKYFDSYVNANDGPYEGGIVKLEVWNSKYVELVPDSSHPRIYYSNYGPFDNPSKERASMQFGIYINDRENGITSDDQVNASKFSDFEWYNTYQEAMQHGKITAVRTDEPDWHGYGVRSYIYDIYLRPIENLSNVGKTGIIRFWAYVYGDEARTQEFKIGDSVDYVSAIIKDDGSGLLRSASPTEIGHTFVITGITLNINTQNNDVVGYSLKTNYNVEEEIINMIIRPSFNAGVAEMTGEANFKVEAVIPKDLSYIEGSSSYAPSSVETSANGGTTVIWNFNNWNLADPLPNITYQLEISPYTSNNVTKTIYAYISSPSVMGGKKNYGISLSITNLAGSSLRKKLSKDKVERNENVDINDFIYNIAQSRLMDFKSYEILPKNGDNFGTHYSGTYTIQVVELADTQRIFYTINPIDNIGLEPDSVGKMHIQNVDLPNDSRWIEIHAGDTIPANATAIASYIPEIGAQTDINYKLKFLPEGNTYGDVYYFQLLGSSANLENAISSEVKAIYVVNRKVSGKVFFDKNRDGKYNSNDTLLANKTVYLVDENDEVVREMTTDNNGYYEAEHFERGNYYIKYIPETGQEFVQKNVGSAAISSVINPDGKTDLIQEFSQNPTNALMHATNQNVGLRYKEAQIVVHHYRINTIEKVHDDVYLEDKTYLYNDSYSANSVGTNELYEEYKGTYFATEETKTGTVDADLVEVIFYYEPTPATITTHHYKEGTNEQVFEDVVTTQYYGLPYTTTRISTSEYIDAGYAGDDISGIVSRPSYEVIYYYRVPKANITVHHYMRNTTTQVHADDEFEREYNTEYTTRSYETTELFSDYQNKYYYIDYHTGDNVTGTVNKSSYEVNYYYDTKEATILVHHYIKGTTTKVHQDNQFTKKYGESYQTSYYETEDLDYDFRNKYFYNSSMGDEITGVVNKDNYEITYYYGVQNAIVTVHHYLEGTTTKVHEDDVISKMFFESYTTRAYNPGDLISPYTDKYYYNNRYSGDAISGIVGKTRYEVNYYYELRDAEIITHYYKYGTEDKVQESKIMYKKMNQEYNTRPLETEELYARYRNVYIHNNETSGDATSGVVEKVKYIVTYYYVPKTSQITVHHYEISKDGNRTTNKVHEDETMNKDYLESYSTRNYESSELEGNYKNNYYYKGTYIGTREGVVGTDNIEVSYYYEAKPSKITVHHYVEGTNEKVHADDVINKLYTDEYETRSLKTDELIGNYQNNYQYNGNSVGDNVSGIVDKDSYEITYYYELRPTVIRVHHYKVGTSEKVHEDDVIEDKKYTEEYEITPYEPNLLSGNYQNNYYYHGEHTGDDLVGVINKDSYEINIYYEARPSTIRVHHYVADTINKVHEDDVIETNYGEAYSTNYYSTSEIDNPYKNVYVYNNETSGDNTNGTVEKSNYEIIYYYDYRPSTVTVHHYIVGTETKVHADDVINKKFMEIYQTSPYNTEELEGEYQNVYEYKSIKSGDQANGTIIGESYEVTYYYDKRPGTITVHHYIKDTEEKLAEDEIINIKLKDHYETKSKESSELNKPNYVYDRVVGEASGTLEEVEREIVYYYKLKEGKLIVHHIAEDTEEKLCPDEVSDVTYQDFYTTDTCTTLSNINYTYKEVKTSDKNSEQRGTKTMGNILEDVVEVTYYYELKPGQIIVYYFEEGTRNRVADDVISNGLSSKEFTSEAKEIEGYSLVKKPESNVHIYKEETQEVIYEYKKNKYNIGVEVVGGVGSITGSEEVSYLDDSQEGNIVITPGEGYEIEKVTIDNEEIEVKELSGMTLENFKKVSKDHKVEVTFKEVEVIVPITGSKTKLILISIISITLSLLIYGYYRLKIRKMSN